MRKGFCLNTKGRDKMSKGKYEKINKASDYEFIDPTGAFKGAMDQYGQMASFGKSNIGAYLDSNKAYNAFMGQSEGLANLAQGVTSPLTQQLNALATQEANLGIANAGTQFAGQGALHSGAAAKAMGTAAAMPFAKVAADVSSKQLDLTSNLWNTAFSGQQNLQSLGASLYGNLYTQGVGGQAALAQNASGIVAPQYEYKKGFGDYLGGAVNTAIGGAIGLGSLGWKPF